MKNITARKHNTIKAKLSKVGKLLFLNSVIWMLLLSLAFGASILIMIGLNKDTVIMAKERQGQNTTSTPATREQFFSKGVKGITDNGPGGKRKGPGGHIIGPRTKAEPYTKGIYRDTDTSFPESPNYTRDTARDPSAKDSAKKPITPERKMPLPNEESNLLASSSIGALNWGGLQKDNSNPLSAPSPNSNPDGSANIAPKITPINDIEVNEKEIVEFTVSANDEDGDSLILSMRNGPEGAFFTDNANGTANFLWVPDWSQGRSVGEAEEYHISFTASDGKTTSSSENVTISVIDAYDPIKIEGFAGDETVEEETELSMTVKATGYLGREVKCSLDLSQLPQGQQDELSNAYLIGNPLGSNENRYYEWTFTWTPAQGTAPAILSPVIFDFDDGKDIASRQLSISVTKKSAPPEIGVGLSLVQQYNYKDEMAAMSSTAVKIARYGKYLLAAHHFGFSDTELGVNPDLRIFDVSNPESIAHVADYFNLPNKSSGSYVSRLNDMGVRGSLLYIHRTVYTRTPPQNMLFLGYDELRIFDISDIENGNIVTVASVAEASGEIKFNKVIIEGGFIFTSTQEGDVFMITDARNPQKIGKTYNEDYGVNPHEYRHITSAFVENSKAYVTFGNKGLSVYDISNGKNIAKIKTLYGTFNLDGAFRLVERAEDVNREAFIAEAFVERDNIYLSISQGDTRGVALLSLINNGGGIHAKPLAEFYNTESDVREFSHMLVNNSVVYLAVESINPEKRGIISLGRGSGMRHSILQKNDDLRIYENSYDDYADILYDVDNLLIYALHKKGRGTHICIDLVRTGLKRAGPESGEVLYTYEKGEDIEIRAFIEDPDSKADELNVWIEDLPDYLDYEYKSNNVLVIHGIIPSTRADLSGDMYIYADDGKTAVSQKVSIFVRSRNAGPVKQYWF